MYVPLLIASCGLMWLDGVLHVNFAAPHIVYKKLFFFNTYKNQAWGLAIL